MSNQSSSLSKNAQIGAYPTIYFNAKECDFKHTTHTPEDNDQLGAQAYMLCKRSNKRIKRLIICIILINISILFGAARICRVENSLDLSVESTNADTTFESLWFDAATLNSIETIELLLLSNKININKSDSDGNTALHIAASQGYKDLLVLLLKSGADILAENNNKNKAIDLARNSNNIEIAGVLYGKSINDDNKEEKQNNSIRKRHKRDVCNKTFANDNLITHKKIHTGEKLYRCDSDGCYYATSYKSHFVAHKRIHTGEKPYKCDICNKAFSQNSSLVIHKRTHTGEKPYKCNICGKAFSANNSFISHKRTHTGEKPYKCGICNKDFSENGNLIKHKSKHLSETLFKMIIDNRKDQIEELLLIKGVDIDAKDADGSTAMHLAVIMSRREILETLIEAGADMTLLNRKGKTAENLAFDLGNSEFVSILQRASKEYVARRSTNKE